MSHIVSVGEHDPEEDEDGQDHELRSFGRLVKVFRLKSDLTQEELAGEVRYSVQYVGSVEQGRRFPSEHFAKLVEKRLATTGVILAAYREVNSRRGLASWFRRWAKLEDSAVTLHTYESRVAPGLLQTEAYARALIADVLPPPTPSKADSLLTARMARHQLLHRTPYTVFSFIVDQSVIDRRTGGEEVTAGLIDHLLECARLPNVDLQLIPRVCPQHAGLGGPFCLMETAEHDWFGYAEGQQSGWVLTEPKDISVLRQRYGKLRIQALNPADSADLLMRLRGEL
ncbi:helix-turn-helix transcriptional regulator [Streptomyces sp. NPDC097619]|uniref:helix-turn-helix domain-containing protein n=1 Tax=Streptomyces sp. NPDC097619 TaxID=3157228 RepID=UPI00331BA9B2